MSVLERPGVSIHYEVYGDGYPLILFAGGGMFSAARLWRERSDAPGLPSQAQADTGSRFDPTVALAGDFMVVAMDQRNAGSSRASVTASDGWHSYTEDHLALMDHLGLETVHIMGECIGASWALGLCRAAPTRVSASVLQKPIGISDGDHWFQQFVLGRFDVWAAGVRERGVDASDEAFESFKRNMWSGDFVFSVTRDFVRSCAVPLLVLPGDDKDRYHSHAVGLEIGQLAPKSQVVTDWAEDPGRHEQLIRQFLVSRTP